MGGSVRLSVRPVVAAWRRVAWRRVMCACACAMRPCGRREITQSRAQTPTQHTRQHTTYTTLPI